MSEVKHTAGFEPCPAYGTLCQYVGAHNDLIEALQGLLREVDETAARIGWADRGERARARAELEEFKREVSEACTELLAVDDDLAPEFVRRRVARFILPAADPQPVFKAPEPYDAEHHTAYLVRLVEAFEQHVNALSRRGLVVKEA